MRIRIVGVRLHFLPVATRVPLKFGTETLTRVTCARARVRVVNGAHETFVGWGETPLNVQWVWPSAEPYELRHTALKSFCETLADAFVRCDAEGHPIEIASDFMSAALPGVLDDFNADRPDGRSPLPWLAALACCSVFDQALHDAYGHALRRPVYDLYGADHMSRDLAAFLTPAEDASSVSFSGRYPADFLTSAPPSTLKAWHLVGGLDAIDPGDLTGEEPDDGHPVLLRDWVRRDGLSCLKVKLRGDDADWDYARLVAVGTVAIEESVDWLSADFNCTVRDPAYVNDILDQLRDAHPRVHGMILYVEQPFPYELAETRIDARSVSARKPLFLDESAHDWRMIRLGRELGWTGVALKTCKTQTGALLSACWAKAHGMTLMVQDLTNPMLAQIPHLQLAAHVGTIMGVETNATQFYPAASDAEAAVHPGVYRRREGRVDLSTLTGFGFGYRIEDIDRDLPKPAIDIDDS